MQTAPPLCSGEIFNCMKREAVRIRLASYHFIFINEHQRRALNLRDRKYGLTSLDSLFRGETEIESPGR